MDARTLEDAYRRYFPVIRAKCLRMLRDPEEAQDLAQETFTRLWVERTKLRDTQAVLAWVYRTATRLAIDRIRRTGTASAALGELHAENGHSPSPAQQTEARDDLRQALGALSRRELEVVILSRVDGLTHDEIGTVTRMSGRHVRRLLGRADACLQQQRGNSA